MGGRLENSNFETYKQTIFSFSNYCQIKCIKFHCCAYELRKPIPMDFRYLNILTNNFLIFKLLKKWYIKFHCKAYTSFLKNTTIKMELMESFAHQTNITYVNLGRPNKSLFFQNWDYSSSTMMQNNIHHSDSDTEGNSSSASGRSESRLSGSWDVIPPLWNVSIGTSFYTSIEEQKKSVPYWPTFWFQSCAI